ncbi:hypothetical protein N7488_008910, partial [Penicillium malachiteum]
CVAIQAPLELENDQQQAKNSEYQAQDRPSQDEPTQVVRARIGQAMHIRVQKGQYQDRISQLYSSFNIYILININHNLNYNQKSYILLRFSLLYYISKALNPSNNNKKIYCEARF